MGNKYTGLFNSIIAPHLHALVDSVSNYTRVKVLVHEWNQEILSIWPEHIIETTEDSSDVIARLSYWIGGLREKFSAGLTKKEVIKKLNEVFYVSLRFYFEYGAKKDVERLIEKFCKDGDKWMKKKNLAKKLHSFKHKIKQKISIKSESSKLQEELDEIVHYRLVEKTRPQKQAIHPFEEFDEDTREQQVEEQRPQKQDTHPFEEFDEDTREQQVEEQRPQKSRSYSVIIVSVIALLLLGGLVIFWLYQTQENDVVVTINDQLDNTNIEEAIPPKISFTNYLNNQEEYPDGTIITLKGFLKYGLPTGATTGAFVYSVVDDFGNELVLAGLTYDYENLIPKGKTSERFEVSGTIKRKFGGLRLEVSQIRKSLTIL